MSFEIENKSKISVDNEKTGILNSDTNLISKGKSNNILYSKIEKISFPVSKVMVDNIPVFESVQLSFYQKHIIMLLERGIAAEGIDKLVENISTLLNISQKCVKEFIDLLRDDNRHNFLKHDKKNQMFFLKDEMHYKIDASEKNIMFAEFAVKHTKCDSVIYVKGLNKCYLENDFNSDVFRKKGNPGDIEYNLLAKDIETITQKKAIHDLLLLYFQEKNLHLSSELSFKVSPNRDISYLIEFEVLLQYVFDKSSRISNLKEITVNPNNFLPKEFIEKLVSEKGFNKDKKIPRFIALNENFYEQIINTNKKISKLEKDIDAVNTKIEPIEANLEDQRENLNNIKKKSEEIKAVAEKEINELKEIIIKKENEIKTVKELIEYSKVNDENLIKDLKQQIAQLKFDKTELYKKLATKNDENSSLKSTLKNEEKKLSEIIENESKKIINEKTKIQEIEVNLRLQENLYANTVKENSQVVHHTINKVISKYPGEINIFNRYITDICISLDGALSASTVNAIEEVAMYIDKIREQYRKILQIIFDSLCNKKMKTLGNYFDPINRIGLDNILLPRGVIAATISNLHKFHHLASAIGHSAENGSKKNQNIKTIEDFKNMNVKDREVILLSLPEFFRSITFNNREIKIFTSKLKLC